MLLVGVPVLVWSMVAAVRGSMGACVVWLGVLAYLGYNSVLFLFATPFNAAFPLYVGMGALTVWSAVTLLHGHVPTPRFSPDLPVRAIAGYLWGVTGLNALVWLARVLPGLVGSPAFLDGNQPRPPQRGHPRRQQLDLTETNHMTPGPTRRLVDHQI
jgi:hypothetical protein